MLAIVLGAYWLFVVRPETREQRKLRKRLKRQRAAPPRSRCGRRQADASDSAAVAFVEALLAGPLALLSAVRAADRPSGLPDHGWRPSSWLRVCSAARYSGRLVSADGQSLVLALAVGRYRRGRAVSVASPSALEALLEVRGAVSGGDRSDLAGAARGPCLPDRAEDGRGRGRGAGRTEFRLLYDRQNFGMPLADALRDFAERVPVLDARFFATAVLTQREAGGNLAEVLDSLVDGDPRAIQGEAAGPRHCARTAASPDGCWPGCRRRSRSVFVIAT